MSQSKSTGTTSKPVSTKDKILKEGRSLLQKHGYNGFSFQDIADKIEIKKPSLYDHFGSKEELMLGIIKKYSEAFDTWELSIARFSPLEKIRKVFDIYYAFTSDKQKVCPILALIVDMRDLSKEVQKEMRAFVDNWLSWLEARILEGQKDGSIRQDMPAAMLAHFIYSQGMGCQFQSRLQNNPEMTLSSGDMLIAFIQRKV
jgi:TetR/AcrR family transcriptional regulator, transcriptional repressor for nem operon